MNAKLSDLASQTYNTLEHKICGPSAQCTGFGAQSEKAWTVGIGILNDVGVLATPLKNAALSGLVGSLTGDPMTAGMFALVGAFSGSLTNPKGRAK